MRGLCPSVSNPDLTPSTHLIPSAPFDYVIGYPVRAFAFSSQLAIPLAKEGAGCGG